jgi:Rrf2 family nitric oxide-sensitive transcriptional repressor
MQLTRFTDYSFRVLILLAREADGLATIDEIAASYRISRNHLMKVVHRLATAGYVETVRGKGGGMRLARPAARILLGHVARDMEENMHIVQCLEDGFRNCTLLPSCVLKTALVEARTSFLETLDRYTLADLAKPGTGRGGRTILRRMPRPKALA